MVNKLAKILPNDNGDTTRVRCFCHTLNLVTKSVLSAFDSPKSKSVPDPQIEGLEGEECYMDIDTEDDGLEDNVDGWRDERPSMPEVRNQVQPVGQVLLKVSD